MNVWKRSLVSLALLGALSGPALADGGDFNQGMVLVVMPNGSMAHKTVTDNGFLEMATKGATPVAPGSVIVMYNGKAYVLADHKMADGHMLVERVMSFQ